MELIKQGAEAKIFLAEYLGEKCLLKARERKEYREKALDSKILSERLSAECTLLSRAKKAGVRTPFIIKIDRKDFSILTEFIEGNTLKTELEKLSAGAVKQNSHGTGKRSGKQGKQRDAKKDIEKAGELLKLAGEKIALLHNNGIIHGDLTTGNIIVQWPAENKSKTKKGPAPRKAMPQEAQGQDTCQALGTGQGPSLVFIDFGLGGLSAKTEDKAVDLLAFKKMFMSTHFGLSKEWNGLEKAYAKACRDGALVLKRIPKIEARARYA